ncbi:MAG: hypothetical protein KatS3mg034_1548 [Vicingaceae bacterium]|jgi:hypothetical protein|nr:MAG: hypothetical protein KatS3mg034_1548 [Vicingaceae bacterium]
MMRWFAFLFLSFLSLLGFSQKKNKVSATAYETEVVDYRDAFTRKTKKGSNVNSGKMPFFWRFSKKKRAQYRFSRKTRKAPGESFSATKSRYSKSLMKSNRKAGSKSSRSKSSGRKKD